MLNAVTHGADYGKTVNVRQGAPVGNPPGRSETRESPSASSARGTLVGAGRLAGYRRQISDGDLILSTEAEVAVHHGAGARVAPRHRHAARRYRVSRKRVIRLKQAEGLIARHRT